MFHYPLSQRVLILALALMCGVPGQSCCPTTGSTRLSTVGRCQKGVLSTGINLEHSYGSFKNDGTFNKGDNSISRNWTQTLAGGVSLLYPWLSVHAEAPVVFAQNRISGNESGMSWLIPGDISTSLQWTLLQDPQGGIKKKEKKTWLPFLDLTLGAVWPTGRSSEQAQEVDQSDVTGTGFTQVLTSVRLTKFITPASALTLGAGYGLILERQIELGAEMVTSKPGDTYNWQASYLYVKNLLWSYIFSTTCQATGDNSLGDVTYKNSGTYQLKLGAFVNRTISLPNWELSSGFTLDPWWNGAGKNQPFAGLSYSILLRRNFI